MFVGSYYNANIQNLKVIKQNDRISVLIFHVNYLKPKKKLKIYIKTLINN